MKDENFSRLLTIAMEEDFKTVGDVTSKAIFDKEETSAVLYSKDSGILAGSQCFLEVFNKVDSSLSIKCFKNDGDSIHSGDKIAQIQGLSRSILEGERIAINFLSFLSGIATETNKYVKTAEALGKALILDTRKTLPGYRVLSKYAVSVGGGKNHRMGLYDMVMIKDNHIDAAGSISAAVDKVRTMWGSEYRIEVECRDLVEVQEAVEKHVDVVMLDNMDPETTVKAVNLGDGSVLFEASGNMDIEKVKLYSPLGVDFLSVGKLTHSVQAFDFSLKIG